MKKYRVMFRPPEMPNTGVKTAEIFADNWRVDSDVVAMYRTGPAGEERVFDVPKNNIVRIIEMT